MINNLINKIQHNGYKYIIIAIPLSNNLNINNNVPITNINSNNKIINVNTNDKLNELNIN